MRIDPGHIQGKCGINIHVINKKKTKKPKTHTRKKAIKDVFFSNGQKKHKGINCDVEHIITNNSHINNTVACLQNYYACI